MCGKWWQQYSRTESAYDFIIAHTTMQPSEKDNKTERRRKCRRPKFQTRIRAWWSLKEMTC